MTDLNATAYRTITFDCYGTLIDWENGILGYLQPLLESYDVHVVDDWVLDFFAEWEPRLQAQGGSYREVLANLIGKYGNRLAFTPSTEAMHDFARSIEYWQPYPDTIPALRRRKNCSVDRLAPSHSRPRSASRKGGSCVNNTIMRRR